jgi:tripartite-type tricarboxylate transporter receptor subunit TctC
VLPDSKFKTLKDMVAYAKANPGKVTYAHAGVGGATHVGMEEFAHGRRHQAQCHRLQGRRAALNDTLGGQVDMLADSSSWAPHVEAGKLRLLATWGESARRASRTRPRSRSWATRWWSMRPTASARPRAGLPADVEKKLRDAFRFAVNSDEFKARSPRSIDAPVMYLDGPRLPEVRDGRLRARDAADPALKLKELLEKG